MKKSALVSIISVICFLLITFIIYGTFSNFYVYADSMSESNDIIVKPDALSIYLSKTDIDKSAGSNGESRTSVYLSDYMKSFDLSFYGEMNSYIDKFRLGIDKESQNVIGVKKASIETNDCIIIGAHYDNSYFLNGYQTYSIGALDNATGVVCLMSLIKQFNETNLPFNIIYVFYGAEEIGLSGSETFINSFTIESKKDILLAINLDNIGCGEYTYYYAGDSANSFTKIFNFDRYNISSMPYYSKLNILSSFEGSAYTHIGLQSDNTAFIREGIKTISFFSGNLNSINAGYKESEKYENISHTKDDNLSTLLHYYPNYNDKLNNVANLIFYTVTKDNFQNTMLNSYKEMDFSFLNNKLIIFGMGIFGILILCGYKGKQIENKNLNDNTK